MLNFLAAVAVFVFCLGITGLAVIMIRRVLSKPVQDHKVRMNGTKKAFILNMLQESARTRNELITAMRERFPDDKSRLQSANYLSVILDGLKNAGIKIVSYQRGTYRIEESKKAVRAKKPYKTPVIR